MRSRQPTLVSAHSQSSEPKMAPSQRMPAEMPQAAPEQEDEPRSAGQGGVGEQGDDRHLGGQADVRVGNLAIAPEADREQQQQAGQQAGDATVQRPTEPAVAQHGQRAEQHALEDERAVGVMDAEVEQPGQEHVQRIARRMRLVAGHVVEVAHAERVVRRVEGVERLRHEGQPGDEYGCRQQPGGRLPESVGNRWRRPSLTVKLRASRGC